MQCIVDDQRDQLLRELVRSVVVGAVGNVGREMIGIHICLYQHVRTCLTCRVRAVGIIRGGLIEERIVIIGKRAVDFIRGYMQELLTFLEAAVRKLPGCLGTVQHNCRTQYIGLYEDLRVTDTSVHMAFRCKMYHTVDIVLCEDLADGFFVTDICLDEGVVVTLFHILQILEVACIGQGIHVDDADLVVIFLKHVVNVVGTDETGSSCYQISFHFFSVLCMAHILCYRLGIFYHKITRISTRFLRTSCSRIRDTHSHSRLSSYMLMCV